MDVASLATVVIVLVLAGTTARALAVADRLARVIDRQSRKKSKKPGK